jgi:hypothetical protein
MEQAMLTVDQIRSKAKTMRSMGAATIEACQLDEIADEIERLREALTEIERLYYTEAKDASWRAAHMRAIATSVLAN